MRIFDVGNTAHTGFWCAAPDAATAIDIAFAAGHARKRQNLHVTDVTDNFLASDPVHHDMDSIRAILDGDRTGRVVGHGHAYSLAEVMARAAAPPDPAHRTRWVIVGD